MDKNKKKTLTISSNLKKKIDTSSISSLGKKSFSVEKKKPYRAGKSFNKQSSLPINPNPELKKKNFARKFLNSMINFRCLKTNVIMRFVFGPMICFVPLIC